MTEASGPPSADPPLLRPNPVLRMFAPEHWGQVKVFSQFYAGTYTFSAEERRAVSGADAHLTKAYTFQRLATEMRQSLNQDRMELDQNGFTPAQRQRDVAALIEAALLEAYSAIDCTAKVVRAIYSKVHGIRRFKGGTRALFADIHLIEGPFPDELKVLFGQAAWYEGLRYIRDELTHLATGSCSLEEIDGNVRYSHYGMKVGDVVYSKDDVFGWLSSTLDEVNQFVGSAFRILNLTLNDTPSDVICGIVDYRMLMRKVSYSPTLSFDDGICIAYQWFELPENPACPFADRCGAYRRRLEI